MTSIATRLFGISENEATFARRGFKPASSSARALLESSGAAFIRGYNRGLASNGEHSLADSLGAESAELRGFAFEGAGMALFLLDHAFFPSRRRFANFLRGYGDPHAYMLHVGAGWAFARLPWMRGRIQRAIESFDPLMRWLVVDGFGFHEGYFSPARTVRQKLVPRFLKGFGVRAFDQGLGRSIWFSDCAEADRVAATVSGFPPERRADLWSGVGLACAYAGEAPREQVCRLLDFAAEHHCAFAQGAAFAAKARQRAGNITPNCEIVCRAATGLDARDAAALTDRLAAEIRDVLLSSRPILSDTSAYPVWRERLQIEFTYVRSQL